jgi:FdhE protein
MNRFNWNQRIQRADELMVIHSFSVDVLRFYSQVTALQKDLYSDLAERNQPNPTRTPFHATPDFHAELPEFRVFLSAVEGIAPQPIAKLAEDLQALTPEQGEQFLTSFWNQPDLALNRVPSEALLARIFLQPYAEYHNGGHESTTDSNGTPAACPYCFSLPSVGVLRREGDGAKRSLICSFCSREWNYGRLVCPACGEESVEKLPVYSSTQFNHIRIEACDTCRHYIKTIDLTKDGFAVPVVDELATIPLNLWAQEHGYTKLHANLLGI